MVAGQGQGHKKSLYGEEAAAGAKAGARTGGVQRSKVNKFEQVQVVVTWGPRPAENIMADRHT